MAIERETCEKDTKKDMRENLALYTNGTIKEELWSEKWTESRASCHRPWTTRALSTPFFLL
jgi:hypothetical protein